MQKQPESLDAGLKAAQWELKRGNIDSSLEILAKLRALFPEDPAPVLHTAAALFQAGRYDEAESLVGDGRTTFATDRSFAVVRARIAHQRRDYAEAIRRWELVRHNFPDEQAGFTGGAHSLQEARRFDEADALLRVSLERFPGEAGPLVYHAGLAMAQQDYEEAVRRWERVRERFPQKPGAYVNPAIALRELRRFDESEAVLQAGLDHFPNDARLLMGYATIAHVRKDWQESSRRWAEMRNRVPENHIGYVEGAKAFRELRRLEEAEQILLEARDRFPHMLEPLVELGWVAMGREDLVEAERLFAEVRDRFPLNSIGYLGGAFAKRKQFNFSDAECILRDGMNRAAHDPHIAIEYALIPIASRSARDPTEAMQRLQAARARFPDVERIYVETLKLLRQLNQFEQAESFAADAIGRFPNSLTVQFEFAKIAMERQQWPNATARYKQLVRKAPGDIAGYIGLAAALEGAAQISEAEAVLIEAMGLFPSDARAFMAFAAVAEKQSHSGLALQRWQNAERRFPHDKSVVRAAFEARLRAVGTDTTTHASHSVDQPAHESAVSTETERMRQLVLNFESLGGTKLGCEFGLFQREFGAEPLGLLRWTDIAPESLTSALVHRFDGVGEPENTELIARPIEEEPEYGTADKRYGMAMHTFVNQKDIAPDRMFAQSCRRLRFLRQKLIDDITAANKLFVYKITDRNLTDDEIAALHSAIRIYGNATLLYVRYADGEHPNGTVHAAIPGLIIGYIDRFAVSMDGQRIGPSTKSWSVICARAYDLWKTLEDQRGIPKSQ